MSIKYNTVLSRDGTEISYLTIGSGPALIVIPGALATALDYESFSNELSKHFTVHTIERRGRGLSGPQGSDYSITRECEDIKAVQTATGSEYIFGHSFGGFVTLEAARNNLNLQRVAIYEPGVSVDGSINIAWAKMCQYELSRKKYLAAFATFAQGINPENTGKLPKWLLKIILPIVINKKERLQKYRLLEGTIHEHSEAVRLNNTYPNYKEISAGVLLLSGGRPKGGKVGHTMLRLEQILPQSKVIKFPAFDHFAPEKKPKEIAEAVTAYFLTNVT